MRAAEVNKPGFLWRGLFILLPLLLLACIGLYSLRQDRQIADVEARERCHDAAEICARQISDGVTNAFASAGLSTFTVDATGDLIAIGGSTNKVRLTDAPRPHSMPAAQRLYDHAMTDTNAQSAAASFSELAKDHTVETEGGLPIWLLAEFQLFKLNPSPGAAGALCSNAVTFPSFVTPEILERVGETSQVQPWFDQWRRDEWACDLYQAVRSQLRNQPSSIWIYFHGQPWLVHQEKVAQDRVVSSASFGAITKAVFAAMGRGGIVASRPDGDGSLNDLSHVVNSIQASAEAPLAKPPTPTYAVLVPSVAGREIQGLPPDARVVHPYPELARATVGDATAIAYLANPGLLYAQQRRRSRWFACIILTSALAATAGLVSAYRGFQEQVRLGEMKTNFVSSVSHELRAPIASMRLLAEGLDRGIISDPAKQKEYYKLLSQESRRLSTLIENILDYSRIDQGRKTFQKDPADLSALVQQTIAMMTPAATDRRVSLVAPAPKSLPDATVVCDGVAIQQALINLLDNAIKHSPPEALVTVGLERAGQSVSLWVEDHGPGIPIEEREKIFQRFYRRGTELRRETQGIGIGLTIVKHIVEAHGGRVLVTGEIGHGSRFTVEISADGGDATT